MPKTVCTVLPSIFLASSEDSVLLGSSNPTEYFSTVSNISNIVFGVGEKPLAIHEVLDVNTRTIQILVYIRELPWSLCQLWLLACCSRQIAHD